MMHEAHIHSTRTRPSRGLFGCASSISIERRLGTSDLSRHVSRQRKPPS
ncbi:hypothetical protein COLSTE_01936 [Collinsella stercoris DSM 13279]|uniref:Uncharacterized protein n=1 Tax=Collinsella stercoris DSM 13279 TaxID=445975 RepID=B6GCV9_9ACTN|nr:hypothetical protein COLSTE_01936 [Collinsella stercoris DSM 13279]